MERDRRPPRNSRRARRTRSSPQAAEKGQHPVVCKMPECYCPEELGQRLLLRTARNPAYRLDADRLTIIPGLKSKGGHLTVDNVRLAHRLCNRIHSPT